MHYYILNALQTTPPNPGITIVIWQTENPYYYSNATQADGAWYNEPCAASQNNNSDWGMRGNHVDRMTLHPSDGPSLRCAQTTAHIITIIMSAFFQILNSMDRSTKGYSQHLQYLGWAESSAKRLECNCACKHENTRKRFTRRSRRTVLNPLQTTPLNPGIVSAESSLRDTIHWGYTWVFWFVPIHIKNACWVL